MLKCYIEDKNINVYGVPDEFNIDDGAVFEDNYNETLDNGTIILSQLNHEIEIEPYDTIVINNGRRMCVDSYTKTQTCLNPPIYRYEITLFSETKKLEGIILPNLAITKVFDQVRYVFDYIKLYLELYGDKEWTLGNSTGLNELKYIECPEMQWNEPTFREVMNDLMMVNDCTPKLNNEVIDCIKLSETLGEVSNKSAINYIQESQSSDDYVSDIKMHLINTANNTNDLARATRIVDKIGFRNDESYLLTTDNMRLQTNFPIWKIFSLKMYMPVSIEYAYRKTWDGTFIEDGAFEVIGKAEENLTPYVLEHSKWLTKDVYYGANDLSNANLSTDYRNTCLYFKRGEKNIENFNGYYESQWLFIHDKKYVFELMLNTANFEDSLNALAREDLARRQALDPPYTYEFRGIVLWTFIDDEGNPESQRLYRYAEFELEYETLDDFVFSASKFPAPTHKRQIVDHQTNSYVDVERQGMLEYFKAKRLGNKMALINARYTTDTNSIAELSQTINDKVIFKRVMSVYYDHTDVNYYATENYVLRDYYTGIKSKIRSWRILSGNEAMVRSELIKYYVDDGQETIKNDNMIIPIHDDLDWYLNNFKYCVMQFRLNVDIYDAINRNDVKPIITNGLNTNAIVTEFTKHKVGNSVVFTIKMKDNYYAGNYVSNYDGENHQVEQKGIGYTDDNGELTGGYICFYNEIDYYEVDRGLKPMVNISVNERTINNIKHYGPPTNTEHMVAKIPFIVYKDNKEILEISIQFERKGEMA